MASRATIWRANQLRYTHHMDETTEVVSNVLEGIRTPDPRLRRPLLYPAELRTHVVDTFLKPTNHIVSYNFAFVNRSFEIFSIFCKINTFTILSFWVVLYSQIIYNYIQVFYIVTMLKFCTTKKRN